MNFCIVEHPFPPINETLTEMSVCLISNSFAYGRMLQPIHSILEITNLPLNYIPL